MKLYSTFNAAKAAEPNFNMIGVGVRIFVGTADDGVRLFSGAFVITKKGQTEWVAPMTKI
jgi:hypothetical protein